MPIHIHKDGQRIGPYTIEEIRQRLASGTLSSTDLAWPDGATEWSAIMSLPEFRGSPRPPPAPPPPPPPSPPISSHRASGIRAVVRDVAILTVLSMFGGVIAGVAAPYDSPAFQLAVGVSDSLMLLVGFVISGCLARGNRWRHLARVAVGVWLVGLNNLFFADFGFGRWLLSSIGVALMMGIGGAVSYLFRRGNRPAS